MKWLLTLILLAVSISLHNEPPSNVLHVMEDQFTARYPQWGNFSPETKAELYYMFDQSKNKHAWFPDHYPKPKRRSFTWTSPKLLYQEYLRKGGQPL